MKWNLEKEIIKEAIHVTGRWHRHTNAEGVYISNWDLLDIPTGRGADEKEALRDMLEKIEAYKGTLEAVKREIEAHLAELEGGENA